MEALPSWLLEVQENNLQIFLSSISISEKRDLHDSLRPLLKGNKQDVKCGYAYTKHPVHTPRR